MPRTYRDKPALCRDFLNACRSPMNVVGIEISAKSTHKITRRYLDALVKVGFIEIYDDVAGRSSRKNPSDMVLYKCTDEGFRILREYDSVMDGIEKLMPNRSSS